MSETIDNQMTETEARDARTARDRARLKRVAIRHSTIFLAAITLWGAADAWATASGWLLAETVALLNAVFAATTIAYLSHEWGHFTGARVSGAVSPVLKEPRSFFMFNFKHELNTRGQFLSMSFGGPVANWSLALATFILLPLETWSQALFFATTVAIAVSVSVFELPVINRVMYGDDPREVLDRRVSEAGNTPRTLGIAAGAVLFLAAI